jgi:predicted Zn-ribbon and HTH transcriptional regulator
MAAGLVLYVRGVVMRSSFGEAAVYIPQAQQHHWPGRPVASGAGGLCLGAFRGTDRKEILQLTSTEHFSNINYDFAKFKEKYVQVTEKTDRIVNPVFSVLRGKRRGKQFQLNPCRKCGWIWTSLLGKRPPQCPNCGNNEWDEEYKLGPRDKPRKPHESSPAA